MCRALVSYGASRPFKQFPVSEAVLDILDFAKETVQRAVEKGGVAVDATCGNGHDTLFLARRVGTSGQVYGFDVQEEALQATRQRLEEAGFQEGVTLFRKGHETMEEILPAEVHGQVQAVMFNLGYLPGSANKTLVTCPETTQAALEAALRLLAPGGVITVVSYVGHPGGREEAKAVRAWAKGLDQARCHVLSYRFINRQNDPPRLLVIQRRRTAAPGRE